jgi:hypothetical protein
MVGVPDPFKFIVIALSGWINQQQLLVIDYLREENRVLREQLGDRRTKFTDDQRRRLAAKAKRLGRKILTDVATIVTPDTLLAWHRKLIAQKYDGTANRAPVGLEPMERSRLWWYEWRTRIGIGAIDASRARYPTLGTILPPARSLRSLNAMVSRLLRNGVGIQPGKSS